MDIQELYTFLLPLIQFLGTVGLILIIACSTLLGILWFIKKVWKVIVGVCSVSFILMIAMLVLGAG